MRHTQSVKYDVSHRLCCMERHDSSAYQEQESEAGFCTMVSLDVRVLLEMKKILYDSANRHTPRTRSI